MNGRILPVLFLVLCLLVGLPNTGAIKLNFSLAWFSPALPPTIKTQIYENQIVPINNAFGLGVDLSKVKESAKEEAAEEVPVEGGSPNGLQASISLATPNTQTSLFSYSIIRDGKQLNEIGDTIQVGDTIRFKPKIEFEEQDWIAQGGYVDSPPIIFLSGTEYSRLIEECWNKFSYTYFCDEPSHPCNVEPWNLMHAPASYAPVFTPRITEFTQTNPYTAENGYPAYLVPLSNGKKAGIQVFSSISNQPGGNPSFECKTLQGALECTAQRTGPATIKISSYFDLAIFVDKIIEGNKAVQANWYAGSAVKAQLQDYSKQFQVVPGNKNPPIADFDCKTIEENNQKFLECDASKSRDPDGTITKYEWDSYKKGQTYKKPIYGSRQTLTVTLKVTDNEGLYNIKTKTYNTVHMPTYNPQEQAPAKPAQQPITELTAEYNPQTKMAEVTAKCETEKINININNAVTGNSVLEKQAIPCNQTTPIGPIKVKAAYKVSATDNPEITPAIFTVD